MISHIKPKRPGLCKAGRTPGLSIRTRSATTPLAEEMFYFNSTWDFLRIPPGTGFCQKLELNLMRVKSLRSKYKRKILKGQQRLGAGTCAQLVRTSGMGASPFRPSRGSELLGIFSKTLISLLNMQGASRMWKGKPSRISQGSLFQYLLCAR